MLPWTLRALPVTAVLATCCAAPPVRADQAGPFRVATFQSDVTLPLGDLLYAKPLATIEHPLLAKGVVLDDGRGRYVLCAVDWCVMCSSTRLEFRTKLAAAAGTEVARVAVQCVHQHTAPTFYASTQELLDQQKNPPQNRNLKSLKEITDRLAAAVKESLDRLEPFDSVGLGQARVDRVAAIRRVFTPEGKLLTRWSACRDPELRAMPEGNIDPMLKTITLARGPEALVRLHYYATHPQTYYREGRASYDFPGMAREKLQEEEGVFQIYFTGCSGDVTAGKYNDGTPKARQELADRLLAGMKASVASTRPGPVGKLQWRTVPVRFTARTDGDRDPEPHRATLKDPDADPKARTHAASRIADHQRLQEPVELSSLEIGPVRILHLPGEPMIAYQHFAQGLAPDGFVAVAGYGVCTPGYICTEKAFEEGGYEPSASAIVPESEKVLKAAIRQVLAVE